MKEKINGANLLLLLLSLTSFWYAKYSFSIGYVGFRGARFYLETSPFMFWLGMIFLVGMAITFFYYIFKKEVKKE